MQCVREASITEGVRWSSPPRNLVTPSARGHRLAGPGNDVPWDKGENP